MTIAKVPLVSRLTYRPDETRVLGIGTPESGTLGTVFGSRLERGLQYSTGPLRDFMRPRSQPQSAADEAQSLFSSPSSNG